MDFSILLLLVTLAAKTEGVSVCPTRELQATEGEVTSPNHPSNYPSNADCTLTIDGGQNVKFKIKFESFEVEEDEDDPNECKYDVLKIIDGSRTFRYCGRGIPSDYTSTGNKISIAFKSDGSFEMNGFKILFSTVEGPKAPNGSSVCPTREIKVDSPDKMEGALYSPNFPNFYPDDQRCTLTLDVPDNYKTIIWFESFSLQYHADCAYDKLVLSDEIDGNTQCGGGENQLPPRMELRGRKVQFTFTSDGDSSATGFYLKYRVTKHDEAHCVCSSGLSYITIDNYTPRNNRSHDDVRFEFKSSQSSGMIMYAKGSHRDFIHVGYKESGVFMFHIDLGTGQAKVETSNFRLNDNEWHKVHLARVDRTLTLSIDDGAVSLVGRTPGGFNRLDIPTSKAYFLGAPTNMNLLLPNFSGCIRNFSVDGYEPITNAWANKPDYTIVRKQAMRLCSASDQR